MILLILSSLDRPNETRGVFFVLALLSGRGQKRLNHTGEHWSLSSFGGLSVEGSFSRKTNDGKILLRLVFSVHRTLRDS